MKTEILQTEVSEENVSEMPETKTPNKKKRFRINRTARKYIFIVSLIAIPVVNFVIFWLYVNIDTILLTFKRFDVPTASYIWRGFQGYVSVFKSMVLGGDIGEFNAFVNSFRAILINLIIFPISFIISYSFYKKIRFRKFFQVIFFLPNIISLVVLCMMVRHMFSSDFGPIALLIEKIAGHPIDWLGYQSDKMWGIITVFCIWAGLGGNTVVLSGAMQRIPEDIIEAAHLDGIGFWREAWSIVLPLVMPTIGVFLIGVVTSVFGFAMQPMLIAINPGIDNKFMTIGWYIFASVDTGGSGNMIQAATIGMLFSVLMLPFIIAVRLLVKKFTPDVQF